MGDHRPAPESQKSGPAPDWKSLQSFLHKKVLDEIHLKYLFGETALFLPA
jgi:hypothetical protein